jgi:hypothetical protein
LNHEEHEGHEEDLVHHQGHQGHQEHQEEVVKREEAKARSVDARAVRGTGASPVIGWRKKTRVENPCHEDLARLVSNVISFAKQDTGEAPVPRKNRDLMHLFASSRLRDFALNPT